MVKITTKPGKYTGSGQGKESQINLEVEVGSDQIISVKALDQYAPGSLADNAFKKMAQKIVVHQDVDVDVVSGASETSRGIIEGVKNALTKADVDFEALKANGAKTNISAKKTINVDVAVVGAGGAGVAAALAARQHGVSVALLEKTISPLGASTFAGGMFAGDSQQQKDQDQVVSKKWLYDEYMDASQGYMNSILVRRIIDESGKTVDWLNENGAIMKLVDAGTGGSFDHIGMPATLHGYQEGGTKAVTKLIEKFKSLGGQMYFGFAGQKLLQDDDGKVVGLIAQGDDQELQVNAKKVIIATGGFGGNAKMRKEYLGDVSTQGQVLQNTGDGLNMAWDAGTARHINGSTHYFWQTFSNEDIGAMAKLVGPNWMPLNALADFPNLRVNNRGQRYASETHALDFAVHGAELSEQPKQTEFVILDQAMLDKIKEGGTVAIEDHYGTWKNKREFYMEFNYPTDTDESIKREHEKTDFTSLLNKLASTNVVFIGQTIAELAEKMGVDPDNLQKSVTQYNEAKTKGEDDLFFSDTKRMIPVEEGPFYAVKFIARNLGTLGGATIDERMRALAPNGEPVANLYVAGADASGMYGKAYVDFEGGTLGFAYISGRLAGIDAAESVKKNK
ncbi:MULTISPECIES: FAD-dependent oxidoreductase [unclassified Lactobacillus]|uniref:FAD-dependent oxidoreductase n=1 Tax=unclassified Lactobacillus TaxID=2620435 RepID=UPI000EFC3DCB|nr:MULTISPECIES: FAD-dependent oxidoreductase [unclassified Lactobacillus]RMC23724.1 FAD-dependent oxidoreductase [Lactobacillus sp. ESL0247]RMC27484.1 FAD-dependent oxidoreductase [Lactobacillus sp. ESL0246]RMC30685.1 FAD-dependent oxidoreductase [Lactobacillus sp. ESL0245]